MNYVGVDLHKAESWFYVMDASGNKIASKSISNEPMMLKEYFSTLQRPFSLAVEATYNSSFFIDIAQEYSNAVYMANSYELKAFAKQHKKTDKIDARLIADILRKGYLPTVTIPDKETKKMRELLRYRMNMVRDRSQQIHRLKCLLDRLGFNSSGNFTAHKHLNAIVTEGMSMEHQAIVRGSIAGIETLTQKISAFEKLFQGIALQDPDIVNLMTIPGLSYFSAALIKSEIITIARFASFNRLCAYAGLAPKVHQSGETRIHGTLNKNRRKNLQWILIEVVPHFIRGCEDKRARYHMIAQRKSKNTAKVALAREMLKIIYHVLKEQRPFYHDKNESGLQRPARSKGSEVCALCVELLGV